VRLGQALRNGVAVGTMNGMAGTPVTETRWLDAEEQRVWRAFLAATQLLGDRLDQELQHNSGIPHTYYEVLVRLSEVPGRRLRMSELADRSLSSRSRLSHAVARLEEAGWVRRETCPTDRRGQLAVLTDAGFAALEAAAPGHVEGVRAHLFDQLTPQQVRQLGEICTAVSEHLRSAPPLADVQLPTDCAAAE
jgi:DNA-binding MarR family transcriptional regulator